MQELQVSLAMKSEYGRHWGIVAGIVYIFYCDTMKYLFLSFISFFSFLLVAITTLVLFFRFETLLNILPSIFARHDLAYLVCALIIGIPVYIVSNKLMLYFKGRWNIRTRRLFEIGHVCILVLVIIGLLILVEPQNRNSLGSGLMMAQLIPLFLAIGANLILQHRK